MKKNVGLQVDDFNKKMRLAQDQIYQDFYEILKSFNVKTIDVAFVPSDDYNCGTEQRLRSVNDVPLGIDREHELSDIDLEKLNPAFINIIKKYPGDVAHLKNDGKYEDLKDLSDVHDFSHEEFNFLAACLLIKITPTRLAQLFELVFLTSEFCIPSDLVSYDKY